MKLKAIGLIASLLMVLSVTALAAPPSHICDRNPGHRHCASQNVSNPETTTTTAVQSATTTTTKAPSTTTTTAATSPTTTVPATTTTTVPTTTTTTMPAAQPSGDVIWSGNRISDWYSVANSGGGTQQNATWSGRAVVEQLLPALDGTTNHGARLNFQGFDDPDASDPQPHGGVRVMPTEATYSATIVVPTYVGAQNNVFQFKQGNGSTREHLWNIGWVPENGKLRGVIRSRLVGDQWGTLSDPLAKLNWYVPIGEPFTVEVFRRISTGSDGRYEVRIDGQLVYTFIGPTAASNLTPRPAGNHEWVLSHYLGRGYRTDGPVGKSSVIFYNASITR
jgi:hypothetical protein